MKSAIQQLINYLMDGIKSTLRLNLPSCDTVLAMYGIERLHVHSLSIFVDDRHN